MLQHVRDLILDQFARFAWSHHSHAGLVHRQLWSGLSQLKPCYKLYFRRALGATERIIFEMFCPQVWSGTYLEPYLESLSVADLRRIYSIVLTLFTVLLACQFPEQQSNFSQELRQLRIDQQTVDEIEYHLRQLNSSDPRLLSRSTQTFVEQILGVKWHPLVCGAYMIFVEAEWQQFPLAGGIQQA